MTTTGGSSTVPEARQKTCREKIEIVNTKQILYEYKRTACNNRKGKKLLQAKEEMTKLLKIDIS